MMRPVTVHVSRALPDAPVLSFTRGSTDLAWTDGTPVDYATPATWANPGTAEVGYRVERAEVTDGITGTYAKIADAPANTTAYADNPSDPTVTYDYRVTAWNAAGDAASNVVTVVGLPKAPTGLTAVVESAPQLQTGSQVAVSWVDNASNAVSVVVERAVGAGSFSVLATLAPTDTSYADTTVVPGTYRYRVNAVNAIGPSAYAGPVNANVPQPGSTSVLLNAPDPSSVGQEVTFTATVSPVLATGLPTGDVTFTVNGTTTMVALDATGAATYTTNSLPAGSHTVTADYSGDSVFLASSASTTQTVTKTATTTVVVSSVNPSVSGGAVTFTTTVTPSTATGSVQFTIDGVDVGAPVPLTVGSAGYSTSTLTVGAHLVSATYGGDLAYLTSTSPTLTQSVGQALRATSTVVTSNRTPVSAFGQNVTFTATVRPATGTGIPTGSVQFSIDGTNVGGVLTLSGRGRATYSTATLSAGSHNVIATYSGSTVFAGGGSATFTQIVAQAASTTVVTSNRNPSVSGQTVTFTARVTPLSAGGTVQFRLDGADVGGPVATTATGRARLVINTLAVASHPVSAVYSGNVNYLPSTSATLTQMVNKAASRTVVRSSGNPANRGTTVVFTATVTAVAPGTGTPAGTVQFRIDGVDVGSPAALNVSGQAAYATSALTVGSHTVSAFYSGDGALNTSTSALITQRIR